MPDCKHPIETWSYFDDRCGVCGARGCDGASPPPVVERADIDWHGLVDAVSAVKMVPELAGAMQASGMPPEPWRSSDRDVARMDWLTRVLGVGCEIKVMNDVTWVVTRPHRDARIRSFAGPTLRDAVDAAMENDPWMDAVAYHRRHYATVPARLDEIEPWNKAFEDLYTRHMDRPTLRDITEMPPDK